jgi:hypothetical protein
MHADGLLVVPAGLACRVEIRSPPGDALPRRGQVGLRRVGPRQLVPQARQKG